MRLHKKLGILTISYVFAGYLISGSVPIVNAQTTNITGSRLEIRSTLGEVKERVQICFIVLANLILLPGISPTSHQGKGQTL
jgi:hypothetical protein